jgi:hypothetical protein
MLTAKELNEIDSAFSENLRKKPRKKPHERISEHITFKVDIATKQRFEAYCKINKLKKANILRMMMESLLEE